MIMKQVGLFFGTFNPFHIGHLMIANCLAENTDLDEVWLVVTPHNPHKDAFHLPNQYHRLEMVYLAIKNYDKLAASDIEFTLPKPNYTCDTLAYIESKHPNIGFSLIMGEDNVKTFHKWKNYEHISESYRIYCYPRNSAEAATEPAYKPKNLVFTKAPRVEVSSSYIRAQIKEGRNVRPLLPEAVWKYIEDMNFYKN